MLQSVDSPVAAGAIKPNPRHNEGDNPIWRVAFVHIERVATEWKFVDSGFLQVCRKTTWNHLR
jgi:hypothetical protein